MKLLVLRVLIEYLVEDSSPEAWSFLLFLFEVTKALKCLRYNNVLILENDWLFNGAHVIHLEKFKSP